MDLNSEVFTQYLWSEIVDFLISLLFDFRADEQTMENQAAFDVLKISKETLLLGINDNSTEIR